MMLIGIDPHKSTHTATAVAPDTNHEVASIRIDASLREYARMLTWAQQWRQRRWAVENAEGLGRHLTSWLLARGEDVVDVPTTATARVRQLSRGGGRKNDRIDAAAAACVAALQGDARPLQAEGHADAIAVFDERRVNLAQSRVRAVNQLHALLRALIAVAHPETCPLLPRPRCFVRFVPAERWSTPARRSPRTSWPRSALSIPSSRPTPGPSPSSSMRRAAP